MDKENCVCMCVNVHKHLQDWVTLLDLMYMGLRYKHLDTLIPYIVEKIEKIEIVGEGMLYVH